jgi:hypothetical protein
MTFQAPYDIMGMRNAVVREDALKQEQQQYNQKMLFDGLMQLGGAIKGMQDESTMLGAMDTGVGLMADLGAIKPDTRDMFMNADKKKKPLLFDLLRQGAFSPYAAGQSAGFQAKAWDEYKSKWPAGGGPSSANNQYGYVYQGP